jgi:hypothetical protein
MRTYRTTRGPFRERPYFKDSEIERICLDELVAMKIYPSDPSPIRIDRFVEKRFGVVPTYDELPEGILGLTKFGPKGVQAIMVARFLEEEGSKAAERRIRTTIAHEGGHGLLHTHLFALEADGNPLFGDFSDPKAPKVLCREPNGSYDGQWWEYQANRTIGALLLPLPLVTVVLEPFLVERGLLGLKGLDEARRTAAVGELVEIFDVNPVVATLRLNEMHPADQQQQGWL